MEKHGGAPLPVPDLPEDPELTPDQAVANVQDAMPGSVVVQGN